MPQLTEMMEAFLDNIKIKPREDGRYSINCRKGLWGVEAPSLSQAWNEAWHYFTQYYGDGEYDTKTD